MAQDDTRTAVTDWLAAWSEAGRTLTGLWAEAMPGLAALTPPALRPNDAPPVDGEDWMRAQADWWGQAWSAWGRAFVPADAKPDRRFADPRWEEPPFSLIRDGYLAGVAALDRAVDALPLDGAEKARARFAAAAWADAIAPTNHPLTNPAVLAKTVETGGQNLRDGLAAMTRDLEGGQLTHVAPGAYEVGRNLATTPGQVIHRTELYELIQYAPTTPDVLATPLVIFPPWINRFYILDLGPEKSFIRWADGPGDHGGDVLLALGHGGDGRAHLGRLRPRADRRGRRGARRAGRAGRPHHRLLRGRHDAGRHAGRVWRSGRRRIRSRPPPSSPRRSTSSSVATSSTSSARRRWRWSSG